MNDDIATAILAKAPIPGYAKSRLVPLLGESGAATLQRWLLRRTVATALAAGVGPVTLCGAPDADHPDFARCQDLGPLSRCAQPAGDLGTRMLAAAAQRRDVAGVIVIGTDCPLLTATHVRSAADTLRRGEDAVVIPAEDGGYVLIGVRQPHPRLFAGVDWGSPRVMAQTRARLAELGWRWHEFDALWDVDVAADFERLAALFPDLRQRCGIAA